VNSRSDLMANIALAIARGLAALAPPAPWTALEALAISAVVVGGGYLLYRRATR